MSAFIVDTRGRSCPEPVLMTKKALEQNAESYEILIDNNTALNNVSRLLKNQGKNFAVQEKGDEYVVTCQPK